MRNLKKILALVLALVMSLSLMATAGAASFQDVTDDNPYKTAIDVLDELKVFQGFEDGSFKPTESLNRAQAAVLVYRIATGDVENKYLDNYTYMAQSKFNDLEGYNWAKGYINYCQNAGIVVGTSATTFDPGAKVTGYQLLVMVLRTLGYGKAGEFTDPKGWELQTAAIAEREGILKNVTGGDFGAPAPRQMVAEILFRGILHDTVTYSALTSGGYTPSGESLGKKTLGLEDIKGVVMANEWADLESGSVLAEGKTRLDVDGKTYDLDVSSELTDVGELRHAYVQNGTKVLTTLEDTGDNNVKDSKDLDRRGEGIKVEKLRGEIKLNDETEFFINFGENVQDESEWRIEYNVKFTDASETGAKAAEVMADFESDYCELEKDAKMTKLGDYEYTKSIKPGTKITSYDLKVIRGIFDLADGGETPEGQINKGVIGSVYVGANSASSTNRNKNLAVEMTYGSFVRDYISGENVNVVESDNGEWLKVIDNDGDGYAEYVLRTDFIMTTITDWNAKTEKWDFEYEKGVKNGDIKLVEGTSELAIGDVILYTWIDGVCHVSKPEPVEMTVAKKGIDYKNETLTGTDETVYDWSGIEETAKSLYNDVSYAVQGVTYDLYQDHFGFTRLYKESDGGLVLLTDGYFETDRRSDVYKAQIWNGEFTDVDVVDNAGADEFISNAVNTEEGNLTIGGRDKDDEGTWKRLYRFGSTYYKYGNTADYGEHNWINHNDLPDTDSYTYNTNIASYMVDADGAYSLSRTVDHRENARTHFNAFAIDVTNYEVKAKNQVLWGVENVDADGKITAAQRINTTTDTVYYLVEGTGKDMKVTTWTGYSNAPSNYVVERAYAVTSYVANTTNYKNDLDYEVAEVVVIENTKDTSVPNAYLGVNLEQRLFGNNQIGLNGLGYHPDNEAWGIDTVVMDISSKTGRTLQLGADGRWPNEALDMMNFYYVDGDGDAVLINRDYGYFRIYAGRVVTSPYVENRNYVQVTKDGSGDAGATQANSYFFPHDLETAYVVTYDKYYDNVRTPYDVDYTDEFDVDNTATAVDTYVRDGEGDRVIYMVDADGNVGFVVNVSDSIYTEKDGKKYVVPGLADLWQAIVTDCESSRYYTLTAEGLLVTCADVVDGRFLKTKTALTLDITDAAGNGFDADELTAANATIQKLASGKWLITDIKGNVTITANRAPVTSDVAYLETRMPSTTSTVYTKIEPKANDSATNRTLVVYTGKDELLDNVKAMFRPNEGSTWNWVVYSGNGVVITDEVRNWAPSFYINVDVTASDGETTHYYQIRFDGLDSLVADLESHAFNIYSNLLDVSDSDSDSAAADDPYFYTTAEDAKTLGYYYGDIYVPLVSLDVGENPANEVFITDRVFWNGSGTDKGGADGHSEAEARARAVNYVVNAYLEDSGYHAGTVTMSTNNALAAVTGDPTAQKATNKWTFDLLDKNNTVVEASVEVNVTETRYSIYAYRAKAVLERNDEPIEEVYIDLTLKDDGKWYVVDDSGSVTVTYTDDWAAAVKSEVEKILGGNCVDNNNVTGCVASIVKPTGDHPAWSTGTGDNRTYETLPVNITVAGTDTKVVAQLKVRLVDGRTPVTQETADQKARAAENGAKSISVNTYTTAEAGKVGIQTHITNQGISNVVITAFEPTAGETTWAVNKTWNVTWTGTYEGFTVGGTFICTLVA